MPEHPTSDSDPRAQSVLDDQIAAYDDLRARCPVTHRELLRVDRSSQSRRFDGGLSRAARRRAGEAAPGDLTRLLGERVWHRPMTDDELLGLHAPLLVNRRVTTRPVELSGRPLDAGERVTVIWVSAHRDEVVLGGPDELRLDRDPADSLLYGRGIHVYPGAPLARLELRVLVD